jgi:hypothetical protein
MSPNKPASRKGRVRKGERERGRRVRKGQGERKRGGEEEREHKSGRAGERGSER